MIKNKTATIRGVLLAGLALMCSTVMSLAQSAAPQTVEIPLTDLSVFQSPGKSWQIAGDVTAELDKANRLNTAEGTGVLVNEPGRRKKGTDLVTTFEHGDMDLELDYMMAKGSNSGVYLQGRYEVQLEDSWGVKNPTSANNGAVYERWDESRPAGQKGYQGYAPRQNVSRAPGLWQNLKISFQAPRFDASGKKIENAKILRAELNGVIIHENVELFGPTRGAMGKEEVAMGPLRLQGDHGAVAFRNMKITNYGKPRPELVNLQYKVYKGKFQGELLYDSIPPEAEGTSIALTSDISPFSNDFLVRYTGTLRVTEPGEYTFNLSPSGGGALMKINNKMVIPPGERNLRASVNLPAGEMPFELVYSKIAEWGRPGIGVAVVGPGIREYLMGDPVAGGNNNSQGPILVDAPVNTILRSFMDLPVENEDGRRGVRVVHAVNVGSPEQVHYTYDMDNGNMVQVWRGGFLDATPMWYSRGDGSSRPVGAVQHFGQPSFTLARLASPQAAWVADTAGSGFRPGGYDVDKADQPTFSYRVYGTAVQDAIRVLEGGKGFRRELTVQNPGENLYARLAGGSTIEAVSKDTYLVDGKAYYRIDEAGGAKPVVRDAGGQKELIVPVRGKVAYSIIF
ncbi:family 16 glycoside hydrolase [Pontibacter pamirensis]|uniref:family 16 glycoside hydrolase n=1 Tax=Pontibacter pamirensis TaxID=2562824 RepID=UPI001389EC2E|nr:family 16 glycoside hydrolase [Pontibacter pamirensis]